MTFQKFKDLFETRDIGPLTKAQEICWERFLAIGLPSKKNEAYRYIKLRDLEERCFEREHEEALFPLPSEPTLLFVNGQYKEHLSNTSGLPKEMIILPLTKAWRTFGGYLQGRNLEAMRKEKDPFAALNGALCKEGAFIYLPPGTNCKVPLNIRRVANQKDILASPRLHICLGKGAKLEVYLRDFESALTQNSMIDIVLEEGSELKISTLAGPKIDAFHIEGLRAVLKKESSLKALLITNGSKMFRYDAAVSLVGEESDVDLKGIAFVTQKNEAHFALKVEHLAPNCRSLQKFKNVVSDHAKTCFEGKIFVDPIAQKTQAYQMNPNLLLSDRALAISRPNLEIFADDVKASHGSVVGQIDEGHLFYLRSRGLNEKEAKKLMIAGFCKEILSEIGLASFQNEALALVSL